MKFTLLQMHAKFKIKYKPFRILNTVLFTLRITYYEFSYYYIKERNEKKNKKL
jgi:hypothetical protein